jgi:hypothetical protein
VNASGSDPRYGWTVVAVLAVSETVPWASSTTRSTASSCAAPRSTRSQVPGRVVFAGTAPALPQLYEAPAVFLRQRLASSRGALR